MKKIIVNICNKIIDLLDEGKKKKVNIDGNDKQKLNAIGETTAILAHDIRKPFASIKAILENIEVFNKNPSKLVQAKREIDLSIKNVERMINEMMDFSRDIKLITTTSSLNDILESSINNCSNVYGAAQITLSYDLKHRHKLFVDSERISKIFVNLLTNAIEAITIMGGKQIGIIRVSSREIVCKQGFSCIEIRIANDGPQFLNEDKSKLFESFFTKGKKKGTGLGLAVAKKIINLSGGEIFAKNLTIENALNGGGVEFIMTLPESTELDSFKKLPYKFENLDVLTANEDLLIYEKFDEIISNKNFDSQNKINLLLLEDEVFYKNAFKNLILNENKLSKVINIYEASTFEEASSIIEKNKIHVAVLDIDIGFDKNGFDVLKRTVEKKIYSVIHSNRCIDSDKEKSITLGAKSFLPKPISIKQIFETILDYCHSCEELNNESNVNKVVCFVDDDSVSRFCFENIMESIKARQTKKTIVYKIFDSAESLLAVLENLEKIDFLFTDQNMGKSNLTGLELLGKIKTKFPLCKSYLLTNEPRHLILSKAKEAGALDVLNPPLDEEMLKNFV